VSGNLPETSLPYLIPELFSAEQQQKKGQYLLGKEIHVLGNIDD